MLHVNLLPPTILRWLLGVLKIFAPLEYAIDWDPGCHGLIPVRDNHFFSSPKNSDQFWELITPLLNDSWGFPQGYSSQGMKWEFTDIYGKVNSTCS